MAENKAVWNEFAPSDGSRFEYDPDAQGELVAMMRQAGFDQVQRLPIEFPNGAGILAAVRSVGRLVASPAQ